MGTIAGIKVGTMNEEKSKRGTNNRSVVQGAPKEGSRFWRQMRFFLGYVCLSSKEEGSSSDKNKKESKSTNDDVRHQTVTSISSSSKRPRSCARSSTPKSDKEIILASYVLRRFSFLDLMLATRNFRAENFFSVEGNGAVFIGWISPNGNFATRPQTGVQVVVKSLDLNGLQNHNEWLADVSYLSELRHPNLVRLIGFCIEGDKRLLVYEYVCGGSLDNHLFNRSMCLPWSIRMKIAIGAANGLAFLHEEASRPITYQDFKTSNILLDENYNAKLSNFGLSNDTPVGTYGYAAPEYVLTGHHTSKSNVYSFGVVLLELLTGRRAMDDTMPEGEQKLVEWLRPLLRNKENFFYLMDYKLNGEFCLKSARKIMRLATHCIRRDPQARPLMSEVVCLLKSSSGLQNDENGLKTGPLANVP